MGISEVLLIGGASGVGKSSVGWEVSLQLHRAGIAHWHLEGDVLDAAWPRPPGDPSGRRLAVRTLRAMAEVFGSAGYERCVFVQTASVIDHRLVTEALGEVRLQGSLLTATADTRVARLSQREIGTDLERHLASSHTMAHRLETEAPDWIVRIPTDASSVAVLAAQIVAGSGWVV